MAAATSTTAQRRLQCLERPVRSPVPGSTPALPPSILKSRRVWHPSGRGVDTGWDSHPHTIHNRVLRADLGPFRQLAVLLRRYRRPDGVTRVTRHRIPRLLTPRVFDARSALSRAGIGGRCMASKHPNLGTEAFRAWTVRHLRPPRRRRTTSRCWAVPRGRRDSIRCTVPRPPRQGIAASLTCTVISWSPRQSRTGITSPAL